jgi:carbamoyltransferase
LGWTTGRFEWGPRALGQRSLCALPSPVAVRERINRVIKRREPFRPFAPAVLAAHAGEYFTRFAPRLAPYMLTVADCQNPNLEAVTHADGTARLQTVGDGTGFSGLLAAVQALGLPPIVLNTSLNGNSEPLCARAADAVGFFAAHPIDALYVEDVCVSRRKP